jgi:hypothetical protein
MGHRCCIKKVAENFVNKSYTNSIIYKKKNQRQSNEKDFNDSFTTGNKIYGNMP